MKWNQKDTTAAFIRACLLFFTEQEVDKNWDYLAVFHHASGSGKFSCCYPDDWLGSVIACAVCTFIQKYILCTKQNVKQFPPPPFSDL